MDWYRGRYDEARSDVGMRVTECGDPLLHRLSEVFRRLVVQAEVAVDPADGVKQAPLYLGLIG